MSSYSVQDVLEWENSSEWYPCLHQYVSKNGEAPSGDWGWIGFLLDTDIWDQIYLDGNANWSVAAASEALIAKSLGACYSVDSLYRLEGSYVNSVGTMDWYGNRTSPRYYVKLGWTADDFNYWKGEPVYGTKAYLCSGRYYTTSSSSNIYYRPIVSIPTNQFFSKSPDGSHFNYTYVDS